MRNILHLTPESYTSQRGFPRLIRDFVQVEDFTNKLVLDVGCGFGSFVLTVLEFEPRRVVGLDITEADIQTAKQHIRDPRAEFMVANVLKLPFPDHHFDTISAWEVIEHIPKNTENIFFSEIHRVLKPIGRLYLSTPFKGFWSCVGDPAWWLIGHRHYSLDQLQALSSAAGFATTKMVVHGNLFSIASSINMYVAKWIFRREPFFKNYFDRKVEEAREKGFVGILAVFEKPSH